MSQVRFQPRTGQYLAAATENVVGIYDVETETCVHSLQVTLRNLMTYKSIIVAADYVRPIEYWNERNV